jgi:hypothetical protein
MDFETMSRNDLIAQIQELQKRLSDALTREYLLVNQLDRSVTNSDKAEPCNCLRPQYP